MQTNISKMYIYIHTHRLIYPERHEDCIVSGKPLSKWNYESPNCSLRMAHPPERFHNPAFFKRLTKGCIFFSMALDHLQRLDRAAFGIYAVSFPRCGTDPLQKSLAWMYTILLNAGNSQPVKLHQHFSRLLAHLCWFNPTWLLVWIPCFLLKCVNIHFLVDQCFMFALSHPFSCLNYVNILFFCCRFNP